MKSPAPFGVWGISCVWNVRFVPHVPFTPNVRRCFRWRKQATAPAVAPVLSRTVASFHMPSPHLGGGGLSYEELRPELGLGAKGRDHAEGCEDLSWEAFR